MRLAQQTKSIGQAGIGRLELLIRLLVRDAGVILEIIEAVPAERVDRQGVLPQMVLLLFLGFWSSYYAFYQVLAESVGVQLLGFLMVVV